ncbi:MAG TPA: hypothetical protein VFN67_17885, partial [Polyangiales bacterium]|nr:hypothetical protein [Polyangiales bacterium]
QLSIAADAAQALSALAEPEPWLSGCLTIPNHLFPAGSKHIAAALDFLSSYEQEHANALEE